MKLVGIAQCLASFIISYLTKVIFETVCGLKKLEAKESLQIYLELYV